MGEEYVRRLMILGLVPSLGPLIVFDDMEGLLKWTGAGSGADYVVEKDATEAYNGLACLHVKTRATAPAAGDTVSPYRDLFQRPGKRYRLELIWRFESATTTRYVYFSTEVINVTDTLLGEVRYDVQNNKWAYRDSGGTYTDIPGGAQDLEVGGWHRLVLEWDEASQKYVKFVSDAIEVDISTVSIYDAGAGGALRHRVNLSVEAETNGRPDAYFDDVLVMEI